MNILANIPDMGDTIGRPSVYVIFIVMWERILFSGYVDYVDDFFICICGVLLSFSFCFNISIVSFHLWG